MPYYHGRKVTLNQPSGMHQYKKKIPGSKHVRDPTTPNVTMNPASKLALKPILDGIRMSQDAYPVCFDDIWSACGHTSKSQAERAIKGGDGIKVFSKVIRMTVDAFARFCMDSAEGQNVLTYYNELSAAAKDTVQPVVVVPTEQVAKDALTPILLDETGKRNLWSLVEAICTSKEQFPVDLDDFWDVCGYANKSAAKRGLLRHNLDFSYTTLPTQLLGKPGRPTTKIMMTVPGFKIFCANAPGTAGSAIVKLYDNIARKLKLQPLFEAIRDSREQYPVNFDDVWRICGYLAPTVRSSGTTLSESRPIRNAYRRP